ncbi:hypothetical protein CC86DRAFT_368116 [Ophiobolus disseminans]|uniref:Zn(2)-C6 fungal-type domain-containing protein n=1 Tax=Ophiobolus disseminans TaxID=1469910 RepID=A0A6A7A8N5_9PLEO|nr:hypothetical protein CC86DRAFT_368116 [Ophiobolus disseminans]
MCRTKVGKCVACWQCKLKCDEQTPTCGQCSERSRICQSSPIKSRRLHVARIDSSAPREDLDRVMNTRCQEDPEAWSIFPASSDRSNRVEIVTKGTLRCGKRVDANLGNMARIKMPPISPEDSLRARFLDLLEAKPTQWHPGFLYGNWLKLVALRLGRSSALDDATLCFVAGCFAHQNRTHENLEVAWRTYGRALSSIQHALVHYETDMAVSSETIAAIKFLTGFEVMLDLGSYRWIPHYQGLGRLLAIKGYQASEDELFRSLYYSILSHDMNEAVSNGVDSAFDSPVWLQFSPPEYELEVPMFGVAQRVMMQLIVRIPRLIRLVRTIRRNSSNAEAAREVSNLADKLYWTDLRRVMENLMAQCTEHVPTLDSELAKYYPESIHFATMSMMEALIRYSYCRIIIIGLCRQLMELGLFAPTHGTSRLVEQEVESAGMIAMSLQHAEQHGDAIPIGSFVSMVPLQVAFGCWCRLQRGVEAQHNGEGAEKSDKLERARFMMEWCRVKCNGMLKRWSGQQVSGEMLKIQVEVLEGGPLDIWKERRLFPL